MRIVYVKKTNETKPVKRVYGSVENKRYGRLIVRRGMKYIGTE